MIMSVVTNMVEFWLMCGSQSPQKNILMIIRKKKYMLNAQLLPDGQTETMFVAEIKNILIY